LYFFNKGSSFFYTAHNYRAHNKEVQKEKNKLKFEMEWINGRGEKTDNLIAYV
jgi:hypothetical protein